VNQRIDVIVRLLMAWAPLTCQGIYRASQSFPTPFSTAKQCRAVLCRLYRDRILGRCPIPDGSRGQKAFAYYLRKRAAGLVPEVADIPKSNSLFHGLGKNPYHALAIGVFGSYLEQHASQHKRIDVLERIRDRQFTADLREFGHPKLIPDATLLVRSNGRLKLLFLELVNQTSVINPGTNGTGASSSLAGKLARYRAFNEIRRKREHPTWHLLEKAYGAIGGFQVLVVSTRFNAQYLVSAAEGSNTMFLFAELNEIRTSQNMFTDPIFWLPRSAWRKQPERTSLEGH